MTLLEQFRTLNIDGSRINLEAGSEEGGYYCTPVGMKVIGWENGIHYGTIEGFGELIFAVNPENFGNNVYPLARNFEDFLRLITAAGSTTAIEQIVLWEREQFEDFLRTDEPMVGQNAVLQTIKNELGIEPMEDAFGYVKALQAEFNDQVPYSDEYYDTLGLPRPDGTETEEQDSFEENCLC